MAQQAHAPVEIKCEETLAFYQGIIKDVDLQSGQALVSYDASSNQPSFVPITSIRPALPPYNHHLFSPQVGDIVEVKAKSAENEPYSWWRASIKSIRPMSMENPANIYIIAYAGFDTFTETLAKDMLRPFNKSSCFTVGDLYRMHFPLSASIAPLLSSQLLSSILAHSSVLSMWVDAARQGEPAIFWIGNHANCQRAGIMISGQVRQMTEQLILKEQQQQYLLRQQQQQQNAANQQQSSSNASQYYPPALPQTHSLSFTVPSSLFGMVIGKRHIRITEAEKIEGVYQVVFKNPPDDSTLEGTIEIIAKNASAALAARRHLELAEVRVPVPSIIIGRVVGKSFSIIRDIESNTNVVKIKVGGREEHDRDLLDLADQIDRTLKGHKGDSAPAQPQAGPWSPSNPNLSAPAPKFAKKQPFKQDESNFSVPLSDSPLVDISIIGPPANVIEAELLLRTHIQLIKTIYTLQQEEFRLTREFQQLELRVGPLPREARDATPSKESARALNGDAGKSKSNRNSHPPPPPVKSAWTVPTSPSASLPSSEYPDLKEAAAVSAKATESGSTVDNNSAAQSTSATTSSSNNSQNSNKTSRSNNKKNPNAPNNKPRARASQPSTSSSTSAADPQPSSSSSPAAPTSSSSSSAPPTSSSTTNTDAATPAADNKRGNKNNNRNNANKRAPKPKKEKPSNNPTTTEEKKE